MSFKDLKMECVELGDELLKLYPPRKNGHVKVSEKKWYLPYEYVENGHKLYNFETRPDDTWLVTYVRSGTTLTQELTWLVANDMNFEEAHQRFLTDRFPFIDLNVLYSNEDISHLLNMHNGTYGIELIQNQPSPRFIKTHMPFDLLPKVINSDCKIIYVARNPRDVVISWYNFQKNIKLLDYQGTFEQFCDLFLNDHTVHSPYWEHVKEAWAMRHKPNLLFLFYEDLIIDLPGTIKKVAAFFGKTYSNEQIAKLVEHLQIDNFRKNSMVNFSNTSMKPDAFVRQGKICGWKEIFTTEIEEKFSKWIADNLKDTDLKFPIPI